MPVGNALYKVTLLLLLPAFACCTNNENNRFQGYVEGEYLQVASPVAGQLEVLAVRRGSTVTGGDLLFVLEHALESAALAEAEQGLARATSQLADLAKGLRPTEIRSIEARLTQARATHTLAQKEFDRVQNLMKEEQVSREAYDQAVTQLDRASVGIEELSAELETAGLGARSDALAAARAEVRAARERVSQARWKLNQKTQNAPEDALVFDTYYNPGEFVPAGFPVISLLPPERVKIRYFVPEAVAGSLRPGERVEFTFDGSTQTHHATVSYVSPKAEYTPPVIYSRDTRSKLVFMVEAVPEPGAAAGLHPGQPVDVRRAAGS